MKCGFCGKELTEGAEFCPECGMILSLGGITNEPDEVKAEELEIPEYTPNVFRAMDFEQEPDEPAMELEASTMEETAEVVEIIPEYTQQEESEKEETAVAEETVEATGEPAEEASEPAQENEAEEATEEEFTVPEYDPNAAVSDEFLMQVAAEEAIAEEEVEEQLQQENEEAVEAEAEYEEAAPEEAAEAVEETAEAPEEEFAPPEYEGELIEAAEPEAYEIAEAEEEVVEAYPVYDEAENAPIAEEEPAEDAGLFAALFESEEAEKIEDITPVPEKKEKKSRNGFGAIVAIIVILACVALGGTYVFKNVLPGISNPTETTTTEAGEKVDGTTENTTTEKATDKKETTTKATTETTTKESTTKESTTKESTTKESTTKESTTKETTTEKTTQEATESGDGTVVEPSEYNLDYVAFFPKDGDISIKTAPSSSAADMASHPYGYPVFAYAKQGDYYYVHSAYHEIIGWVSAKDIEQYEEQENTTQATEPEQEVTDAPEEEQTVSYLAMINSAEGLNFRSGPGYDYGADFVIPGGYYVRVTAVSDENPGWVYVTVEDERYPYGSPSGWVLEEYLM